MYVYIYMYFNSVVELFRRGSKRINLMIEDEKNLEEGGAGGLIIRCGRS